MNPSVQVLRLKTPRFAHNAVVFSPFFDDHLAVASGTNFGLVGNGRVHILKMGPGGLQVAKTYDTQECVYDVAWNEAHENQVIAACADGSIQMFDITLDGAPVRRWHEHTAEIMSIDWNNVQKDTFATASWDQSVRIWNLNRATSHLTIPAHAAQIYAATFHPSKPYLLATCAADGLARFFDLRTPPFQPQAEVRSSAAEALCVDWNKYDTAVLAVAGSDKLGKIYDLRALGTGGGKELAFVEGHGLSLRKVQWSPHQRDVLATTSYDMTCRTWQITSGRSQPWTVHAEHTEFVMGVGWALFDPGLIASCAWDNAIHAFRV